MAHISVRMVCRRSCGQRRRVGRCLSRRVPSELGNVGQFGWSVRDKRSKNPFMVVAGDLHVRLTARVGTEVDVGPRGEANMANSFDP